MINQIALSNGEVFDVVTIDRSNFYRGDFAKEIAVPPTFNEFFTEDEFYDEKRSTEELLRDALGLAWRNNDEFAVGRDTNFAYTLCGGVYSTRMICREYLETLHGVLKATRHRDNWAYDTSVELADPFDGMTVINFVLQQNRITVLDWGLEDFDFIARFGRSLAR